MFDTFLFNFSNIQVGFEKDRASVFDAGVAVDDINFIDCEMPRPSTEECGTEKPFHCMNSVRYLDVDHILFMSQIM